VRVLGRVVCRACSWLEWLGWYSLPHEDAERVGRNEYSLTYKRVFRPVENAQGQAVCRSVLKRQSNPLTVGGKSVRGDVGLGEPGGFLVRFGPWP